jgi:hypothetical protein
MSDKKRFHVTISQDYYEKIEESARRYGITVNAFVAFILGQWVDMNYNMESVLAEKVENIFSDPEKLFSNPKFIGMVREILKNDEEFKKAAQDKLDKFGL